MQVPEMPQTAASATATTPQTDPATSKMVADMAALFGETVESPEAGEGEEQAVESAAEEEAPPSDEAQPDVTEQEAVETKAEESPRYQKRISDLTRARDEAKQEAMKHEYSVRLYKLANEEYASEIATLRQKLAQYEEMNPHEQQLRAYQLQEKLNKQASEFEKEMSTRVQQAVREEQRAVLRHQIEDVASRYSNQGITSLDIAQEMSRSGATPAQAAEAIIAARRRLYGTAPKAQAKVPQPIKAGASIPAPKKPPVLQSNERMSLDDEMASFWNSIKR